MKNYAKVGNRRGRPAYRTPSSFRSRQYLKVVKTKFISFGRKGKIK
ncbi:MAG: hypothetical protein AAB404_02740 [Patescibacteria group bacterium]